MCLFDTPFSCQCPFKAKEGIFLRLFCLNKPGIVVSSRIAIYVLYIMYNPDDRIWNVNTLFLFVIGHKEKGGSILELAHEYP
jgi:hypothetical protein